MLVKHIEALGPQFSRLPQPCCWGHSVLGRRRLPGRFTSLEDADVAPASERIAGLEELSHGAPTFQSSIIWPHYFTMIKVTT